MLLWRPLPLLAALLIRAYWDLSPLLLLPQIVPDAASPFILLLLLPPSWGSPHFLLASRLQLHLWLFLILLLLLLLRLR